MAALQDPITINNTTIRNRVVFPPTVVFWALDDGTITDDHVAHYRRRAQGGAGIVVVEATCVMPTGRISAKQPGIWSDAHIPGLKRITDSCRSAGATVLIQLHHSGYKSNSELNQDPVSPSDYDDGEKRARAMTVDEIGEMKDAFIDAAIRAEAAGFHGVELHGAHGFLLNQFANPFTNRREDSYGGNLSGRLRLADEIIRGIRSRASKGFIISARIGCNEPTLDDGAAIAAHLEESGLDLIHVSGGLGGAPDPEVPGGFQGGWILYGGTYVKKHVSIPVIVVNGIRTHDHAAWLLDGRADFVALCRGILVDPDWPRKAETGEEIVTCVECKPRCKWFEDGRTCPRFDEAWMT